MPQRAGVWVASSLPPREMWTLKPSLRRSPSGDYGHETCPPDRCIHFRPWTVARRAQRDTAWVWEMVEGRKWFGRMRTVFGSSNSTGESRTVCTSFEETRRHRSQAIHDPRPDALKSLLVRTYEPGDPRRHPREGATLSRTVMAAPPVPLETASGCLWWQSVRTP